MIRQSLTKIQKSIVYKCSDAVSNKFLAAIFNIDASVISRIRSKYRKSIYPDVIDSILLTYSLDEFKTIPDYPNYFITKQGDILSISRNRLIKLKLGLDKDGYAVWRTRRNKNLKVHTLVLNAFVGKRPEGMVCCHKDGNKLNNNIENLRWDTCRSNIEDSKRHGTWINPIIYCRRKLTWLQVRIIRKCNPKVQNKFIAHIFNIKPNTVSQVRNYKRWTKKYEI